MYSNKYLINQNKFLRYKTKGIDNFFIWIEIWEIEIFIWNGILIKFTTNLRTLYYQFAYWDSYNIYIYKFIRYFNEICIHFYQFLPDFLSRIVNRNKVDFISFLFDCKESLTCYFIWSFYIFIERGWKNIINHKYETLKSPIKSYSYSDKII